MREGEAGEGRRPAVRHRWSTTAGCLGRATDVWLPASELKLQPGQQNSNKSPSLLAVQTVKREREVSDCGRALGRGVGEGVNMPVLILAANRRGFPASKAETLISYITYAHVALALSAQPLL